MKVFTSYEPAYDFARHQATSWKMDVGIEKAREFGTTVYRVKLLPKPENRYGHELTCQVVTPNE